MAVSVPGVGKASGGFPATCLGIYGLVRAPAYEVANFAVPSGENATLPAHPPLPVADVKRPVPPVIV